MTCDYGGLKDEMIRDKIVLGISNEGTRRRLLSEKKLTLLTAIEMCRTAEQTGMHMRAMDAACMPTAETVHTVARKPFRPNQQMQSNSPRLLDTSKTCRYCGNMHSSGQDHYPAYGRTCRLCGTNNHFAKVCLKSKSRSTEGKLKGEKYQLSFEIVESSQNPLLSGSTCEQLGLMQFTIPDDVLKIGYERSEPLTKEQLIDK